MKGTAVSNGTSTRTDAAGASSTGSTRDDLLRAYRTMVLSRRIDDKEIQLKNQSLIFFQISGAGHEAILVAAGLHARSPATTGSTRTIATARCASTLGMTPLEMLLAAVGAKDDPSSGGRQMPSHWGHKRLNIVSQSSPTGTQCLQAIGCAEAGAALRARHRRSRVASRASTHDEVTYLSIGDGATSEGEFWESLNTACLGTLPVVYLVEDNGYAISVPVEVQTAGGDISKLVASFPGLFVQSIDGTDFLASYRAMSRGRRLRARAQGPGARPREGHPARTRTRCRTTRSCTRRRTSAPRKRRAIRSSSWPRSCKAEGLATEAELAAIAQRGRARGERGGRRAIAAPKPTPDTATLYVYSPDVDPTSERLRARAGARRQARHDGRGHQPHAEGRDGARPAHRRLRRGRRRLQPRGRRSTSVPGKGGVFKVTHGLQRAFGSDRVFNSPLAEANIIGRAVGMATRGLKPVVEIQFFDYIWPAMMQIRDEMSMLRYRSNNAFSCPMVIRVADRRLPARRRAVPQPVGREHLRALPRHPHRVPVERAGRGRPAAHGDPLRRPGALPRAQAPLPPDLQQGRVSRRRLHGAVRQGRRPPRRHRRRRDHVGRARAAVAARRAAGREGRHQRRWWSTCARSCRSTGRRSPRRSTKTNRVVIAHEDQLTCGFGAEIAARIADELFEHLDAPVRRVAALDTPVAYYPDLEEVILPQSADVLKAIQRLARY